MWGAKLFFCIFCKLNCFAKNFPRRNRSILSTSDEIVARNTKRILLKNLSIYRSILPIIQDNENAAVMRSRFNPVRSKEGAIITDGGLSSVVVFRGWSRTVDHAAISRASAYSCKLIAPVSGTRAPLSRSRIRRRNLSNLGVTRNRDRITPFRSFTQPSGIFPYVLLCEVFRKNAIQIM